MSIEETKPGQGNCSFYVPLFPLGYESKELEKGEHCTHRVTDYHILFVLKGELSLSFDSHADCRVKSGEMFFLHAMVDYKISVLSPTKVVEIRFNRIQFPCTYQARNRLLRKLPNLEPYQRKGTCMKKEIRRWLHTMNEYWQAGLSCNHLLQLKNQELFLLIKHYYTDEEKIQFFHFTLDMKTTFHESVLEHYSEAKTVQELASSLGYGVKTFRNVFKEHFGETPHKWMQQQTALRIKARLMDKSVSLKQIMFEFKFDSSSHFYHYCRKQFGTTPTQLRNEVLQE